MTHPTVVTELEHALRRPARVRDAVARRPVPGGGGGRRAGAVLVLLGPDADDPEVLLIERAAGLRHHAGQIAFPGGGREPGDADLTATALREAYEETGLNLDSVDVLGALPSVFVAVSGFDVTAVIGWATRQSQVGVVDPGEVAAVHRIPRSLLMDPAHRVSVRHPSGYTGPAFVVADVFVWGLTAHILDAVTELAGWSRDWDRDVRVEIPPRYLRDRR